MAGPHHRRVALLLALALAAPAVGQGTGGPAVSGSRVGYIDNAIPGDLFRLRFNAAFDNDRPTRAEFVWARAGTPDAPGPPGKEFHVDYQEFTAYLEKALTPRISAFAEMPVQFINPTIDPNEFGVGDVNGGFKWALVRSDDLVATFQFRGYAPTGDARRGLGNRHASLEPSLLVWAPVTANLLVEGEFRAWVPVGGTSFAGEVFRYGLGVSYNLGGDDLWVAPVAEVVGWTALGGKVSVVEPSGAATIQSAAGDTIVSLKLGLRVGMTQRTGFYLGYGRALTAERWYQDTLRVELRLAY